MFHPSKAVMLPTGTDLYNDRRLKHLTPTRLIDDTARIVRKWDGPISAKVRSMARGFESKSVESQQEEAQRAKVKRPALTAEEQARQDRKSTRLNSSHVEISYAVFCLKK